MNIEGVVHERVNDPDLAINHRDTVGTQPRIIVKHVGILDSQLRESHTHQTRGTHAIHDRRVVNHNHATRILNLKQESRVVGSYQGVKSAIFDVQIGAIASIEHASTRYRILDGTIIDFHNTGHRMNKAARELGRFQTLEQVLLNSLDVV